MIRNVRDSDKGCWEKTGLFLSYCPCNILPLIKLICPLLRMYKIAWYIKTTVRSPFWHAGHTQIQRGAEDQNRPGKSNQHQPASLTLMWIQGNIAGRMKQSSFSHGSKRSFKCYQEKSVCGRSDDGQLRICIQTPSPSIKVWWLNQNNLWLHFGPLLPKLIDPRM